MFDKGWYSAATHLQSPNFNKRPDVTDISLAVIHCISLPNGDYNNSNVEDFFQNKLDIPTHESFASISEVMVSAHFFIKRSGKVVQFVSVDDRAWHAGKSNFDGREACNDFSIGIELQGNEIDEFKEKQYTALNTLLVELKETYPTLRNITGHEDIAPGRKTDPGPTFEWNKVIF